MPITGSVGSKCTGQMRSHTSGTDDRAKTVAAGGLGKRRCLGRSAMGTQNMGLERDAKGFQLGAGSLDDRPIAVGPHNNRNFFAHHDSLL